MVLLGTSTLWLGASYRARDLLGWTDPFSWLRYEWIGTDSEIRTHPGWKGMKPENIRSLKEYPCLLLFEVNCWHLCETAFSLTLCNKSPPASLPITLGSEVKCRPKSDSSGLHTNGLPVSRRQHSLVVKQCYSSSTYTNLAADQTSRDAFRLLAFVTHTSTYTI